MRKDIIVILCFLFPAFIISVKSEDSQSEKRIWNLLSDLKDHKAKRLKLIYESQGKIEVPNPDADKVKILETRADPNVPVKFGFSFPMPDLNKSKIESIEVDMNFVWPSSQGAFQLTFGSNTSMFSGTGAIIAFYNKTGITVGKLNSGNTSNSAISTMGSTVHSLKITYNPKDEMIYAILDKKTLSASASNSPRLLRFLAKGFEEIEIRKLKMTITLAD